MSKLSFRCSFAMMFAAFLPGCGWMPGKPTEADKWEAPHDVLDAKILYARNCRGCHGAHGEVSGAIAMDNPMYLAVVPRETLRTVIAGGVPGTGMVGFAEEHGGPLTEKQIDALVEGISGWGKNPPSGELPTYSAPLGNLRTGRNCFRHLLRELPWR